MGKTDRLELFTSKLTEFSSNYDKVRAERIKERKDKRREQRRIQWANEKEEEEQRQRDEELKRQREEEERIEMERRQAEIDEIRKRKEAADLILEKQREREREAKQKRKEDESREKEREAREKDREQTRDVRGGGERERQTEGSSWRRGGESAPAAAAAEIRSSEPYRPPTEARWRDKTRDKYSRPEPETERRPDTDERRDRVEREEQPEPSSWRSARDAPASESRVRDREPQRPVERGARDFAALRDPGAKKTVEFERRDDDRGMRRGGDDREFRRGGDDREIRRGGDDREIRRGPPAAAREGESNWRSMRPSTDRPQD